MAVLRKEWKDHTRCWSRNTFGILLLRLRPSKATRWRIQEDVQHGENLHPAGTGKHKQTCSSTLLMWRVQGRTFWQRFGPKGTPTFTLSGGSVKQWTPGTARYLRSRGNCTVILVYIWTSGRQQNWGNLCRKCRNYMQYLLKILKTYVIKNTSTV